MIADTIALYILTAISFLIFLYVVIINYNLKEFIRLFVRKTEQEQAKEKIDLLLSMNEALDNPLNEIKKYIVRWLKR